MQDAIEGKLTADWRKTHPVIKGNPNFNAEALFEKIQEKKMPHGFDFAHAKSGKKLAPITDEEKPFAIPDGWKWVRLGEICEFSPRNKLSDETEVGFVPMPLISNQFGVKAGYETKKWKEVKSGFTHFADNDVAIAKITPCFENSKATIFSNLPNGFGAGTTELFVLRPISIYNKYLYLILKTTDFIENGTLVMTGACGQKRLPKSYVENYLASLPPLAEQTEIVRKVESLLAKVAELENQIA